MYSTHDTDWAKSSKGNFWRRFNGKVMVVGTKDGDYYWAMIDGDFLKEQYLSPEDAQEVCAAIRIELRKIAGDEIADNCRILYGGSVKSINTLDIMKEADVDGALVGGASLDPEEFARIAKFHRVLNKA